MLNMMWDGKLFELQERVIRNVLTGQGVPLADEKLLRGNVVSRIAELFSPCNLNIVTFCLIDVLSGVKAHENTIKKQCMHCCGAYGKLHNAEWWKDRLWLEGYDYWNYVKSVLKLYRDRFDIKWVSELVCCVEDNFQRTGYYRESAGRYYPVPLGDIYDLPLNTSAKSYVLDSAGPVVRERISDYHIIYIIRTDPVGFNLHTSRVRRMYSVLGGSIKNFRYYNGYRERFPTVWSEIAAMLKWSRFVSIFKMWFL